MNYKIVKADYDWNRPMELPHQFSVDETPHVDTGLVDPHGNRIFRTPEPIGFVTAFPKPKVRVKAGRSIA